jgi:phospholipid/cholesterol/gamma-HCH transport system ATP-binding protein
VTRPFEQGLALSADSLEKRFGAKTVLRGATCDFLPGEISVVIGPSGCGKSTLLRMLIGLATPDAGAIYCNGEDLTRLDRHGWIRFRHGVGMVFQSGALFDSMTVAENVGFSLREHTPMSEAAIREIADAKLAVVGLAGTGDAYPSELSGGMQKRVAIARAIARDPQLILYDEPTTGLDPITSTVIEDLIVRISRETRATSIVVTHQLSTIFRTADRITMVHQGHVIGSGTPDQMRASTDPVIASFLTGEPAAPPDERRHP